MRWITLPLMALALVAAGCGASKDESAASDETTTEETVTEETVAEETVTEETVGDSTTAADTGTDLSRAFAEGCPVHAYVGWSIWRAFRNPVGGGDANKVPDEIKADVETLAQALVTHSSTFEEFFPPEDLRLPPGSTPTANESARFAEAMESLEEAGLTPSVPRLEAWMRENC